MITLEQAVNRWLQEEMFFYPELYLQIHDNLAATIREIRAIGVVIAYNCTDYEICQIIMKFFRL